MVSKQKKINVTFRQNELEENLYRFAIEQGKQELGGAANYIKRLILEDKKRLESK